MALDFLKEGRQVFSNIEGFNRGSDLPADWDWRELPDGSVVFYDEAQQKFPQRSPNKAVDSIVKDLEVHRHRGFDLVFITQFPTFIDHHIRYLCGRHEHLERKAGLNGAVVFGKDEAFDVKDFKERAKTDKTIWKFPKELFNEYASATKHTHKVKVPGMLKWVGLSIIVLIIVVVMAGKRLLSMGTSALVDTKKSVNTVSQVSYGTVNIVPVALILFGCVATDERCQCYDETGVPLLMSLAQCRVYLENPIPRRLKQEES